MITALLFGLGMHALPPLLFLDGLLDDMTVVLKIFVLLTVVSYVIQHLGKGPVALIVIVLMSWFILFDQFLIFGGVYVLYMLALFGGVQLLTDFFFVAPNIIAGGHGGNVEAEEVTGLEMKERQKHLMHLRQRAGMG